MTESSAALWFGLPNVTERESPDDVRAAVRGGALRFVATERDAMVARIAAHAETAGALSFGAPRFSEDAKPKQRRRAAKALLRALTAHAEADERVAFLETRPADDVAHVQEWLDALVEAGFEEVARAHLYMKPIAAGETELAPSPEIALASELDPATMVELVRAVRADSLDAQDDPRLLSAEDKLAALKELSLVPYDPSLWLVLRDDDRACGYVFSGFERNNPKSGWILDVGVLPSYRGRGLSEALIGQALRALARAGCEMALAMIDDRNEPSRRAHVARGFEPGDDAFYVYRRVLARQPWNAKEDEMGLEDEDSKKALAIHKLIAAHVGKRKPPLAKVVEALAMGNTARDAPDAIQEDIAIALAARDPNSPLAQALAELEKTWTVPERATALAAPFEGAEELVQNKGRGEKK